MDRVPKAHGVDFKVWADRLAVIMMLMMLAWCLAGLMNWFSVFFHRKQDR